MMVSPSGAPSRPKTVRGNSSVFCTAQMRSCSLGGRICAGSPTAIQPMGTVAPTGTAVFTCTTPLIRTSERAPRRAPLKTLAPVATKTESATAAREMRVGTDQDVVADADRVSGCAPQHGLFHDDAVLSNRNGPAFGDEYRAEQHAALSAYGHVAADGGGGRDVGGFVDVRSLALVFEQHGIPPPIRRVAPILSSTHRYCTAGGLPRVHFTALPRLTSLVGLPGTSSRYRV